MIISSVIRCYETVVSIFNIYVKSVTNVHTLRDPLHQTRHLDRLFGSGLDNGMTQPDALHHFFNI